MTATPLKTLAEALAPMPDLAAYRNQCAELHALFCQMPERDRAGLTLFSARKVKLAGGIGRLFRQLSDESVKIWSDGFRAWWSKLDGNIQARIGAAIINQ